MNQSCGTAAMGGSKQARAEAQKIRMEIRAGEFTRGTEGQAPGIVQGNVAIMPADWAADFVRFCHFNPKSCPLIGVTEPGDPFLPMLGDDIDIRKDVPAYRVFRDGVAAEETNDITDLWRDDLVAFVIGCSYSFEDALLQANVPLRHIENRVTVPMYWSNIPTTPAGPFHGPTVVSMRPLKAQDAIRAVQITSRFPNVHGSPLHFGDPAQIGIKDLNDTYFSDPLEIKDGEVPVFWACGVTPQAVIEQAKPPFSITHMPGHMLITDLLNAELSIL